MAPEPGFQFSIVVDLEQLPAEPEAREALVTKIALLKRNMMAAPFEAAFAEYYKLKEAASKYTSEEAPQGVREGGEVMAIHYREEEAIYCKASHDRVTVIFSTVFREETDRVFGKVFIQEFVDARRRAIQNAPQVLFRNDPPLELQGVPGVKNTGTGEIGYVTFVLFPRHLTPQRMPEVISHIQTFRDYFHYHIKASKAYIHSRMRRRTADFLQGESGCVATRLLSKSVTIKSIITNILSSTPESPAGQRGEGAQDGQRPYIQGAVERHVRREKRGCREECLPGQIQNERRATGESRETYGADSGTCLRLPAELVLEDEMVWKDGRSHEWPSISMSTTKLAFKYCSMHSILIYKKGELGIMYHLVFAARRRSFL